MALRVNTLDGKASLAHGQVHPSAKSKRKRSVSVLIFRPPSSGFCLTPCEWQVQSEDINGRHRGWNLRSHSYIGAYILVLNLSSMTFRCLRSCRQILKLPNPFVRRQSQMIREGTECRTLLLECASSTFQGVSTWNKDTDGERSFFVYAGTPW